LLPLFIRWVRFRDDVGSLFLFFYQWLKTAKCPDMDYIRTGKSPIERKLYVALKAAGYRVKSQYTMGPYRCDLAITKYKLVIECDGATYHSSKQQKDLDRRKTYYIQKKHRWRVLRFTGSHINRDMAKCMEKIHLTTGLKIEEVV
jgi:very-short-patch-repair endonuclease